MMTEQQIQYWSMIIQAIVGLTTALIGIAGVLVGHFVLSKAKNRESLDVFWGKYALSEGVEPLLVYVGNHEERVGEAYFRLANTEYDAGSRNLEQKIEVIPMPSLALYRVVDLVDCITIKQIIDRAETYIQCHKDEKTSWKILNEVRKLHRFLRLIHAMFSVSRIDHRKDIGFAPSRKPLKEVVDFFLISIEKGDDMETEEDYISRAFQIYNIFGEPLKEKMKFHSSLNEREHQEWSSRAG